MLWSVWSNPGWARAERDALPEEFGSVWLDIKKSIDNANLRRIADRVGMLPEHVIAAATLPRVIGAWQVAIRFTGTAYSIAHKHHVLNLIAKGVAAKELGFKDYHSAFDGYVRDGQGNLVLNSRGQPMTSDYDLAWIISPEGMLMEDGRVKLDGPADPEEKRVRRLINTTLKLWHPLAGDRFMHGPAIASAYFNKELTHDTERILVSTADGLLIALEPHHVFDWLERHLFRGWKDKYSWIIKQKLIVLPGNSRPGIRPALGAYATTLGPSPVVKLPPSSQSWPSLAPSQRKRNPSTRTRLREPSNGSAPTSSQTRWVEALPEIAARKWSRKGSLMVSNH